MTTSPVSPFVLQRTSRAAVPLRRALLLFLIALVIVFAALITGMLLTARPGHSPWLVLASMIPLLSAGGNWFFADLRRRQVEAGFLRWLSEDKPPLETLVQLATGDKEDATVRAIAMEHLDRHRAEWPSRIPSSSPADPLPTDPAAVSTFWGWWRSLEGSSR